MVHARRKLCVSIIRTILSSAAPSHELTLAHARGGDHLSQWRKVPQGERLSGGLEARDCEKARERVIECTVTFDNSHFAVHADNSQSHPPSSGELSGGELANVQFSLSRLIIEPKARFHAVFCFSA